MAATTQVDQPKMVLTSVEDFMQTKRGGKVTSEELIDQFSKSFGDQITKTLGEMKNEQDEKKRNALIVKVSKTNVMQGHMAAMLLEKFNLEPSLRNDLMWYLKTKNEEIKATADGLTIETVTVKPSSLHADAVHAFMTSNDMSIESKAIDEVHKHHVGSHLNKATMEPEYYVSEKDAIWGMLNFWKPIYLQLLEQELRGDPRRALQGRERTDEEVESVAMSPTSTLQSGSSQAARSPTYAAPRRRTTTWTTQDDDIILAKSMLNIDDNNKVSFRDAFGYTTATGGLFAPIYATGTSAAEGTAIGASLKGAAGFGATLGSAAGVVWGGASAAGAGIGAVQAKGHLRDKDKTVEGELKKGKITTEIDQALNKTKAYLDQLAESTQMDVQKRRQFEALRDSIEEFQTNRTVPTNLGDVLKWEGDKYLSFVNAAGSSITKTIGDLNDVVFDYHIHAQVVNTALKKGHTGNQIRELQKFGTKAEEAEEKREKVEERLRGTGGWRSHVIRSPEKAEKTAEKAEGEAEQAAKALESKADAITVQVYTLMAEKLALDLRKRYANAITTTNNTDDAREKMRAATVQWLQEVTP